MKVDIHSGTQVPGGEQQGFEFGTNGFNTWNPMPPLVGGPAIWYTFHIKIDAAFDWGTQTGKIKMGRVAPDLPVVIVNGQEVRRGYTSYIGNDGGNYGVWLAECDGIGGCPSSGTIAHVYFDWRTIHGDGTFHKIQVKVLGNSTAASSDAELEVWIDDVYQGIDSGFLLHSTQDTICYDGWEGMGVYIYPQLTAADGQGGIIWIDDVRTDTTRIAIPTVARNVNFEGGTVGQLAINANSSVANDSLVTNTNANTLFSNTFVHSGSISLAAWVRSQAGDSNYGGSFSWGTNVGEGQEVWCRFYVYYPVGTDFTVGGTGLKIFRMVTSDNQKLDIYRSASTGKILPHSDLSNSTPISTPGTFNTWIDQKGWLSGGTGNVLGTGVWHQLEMYIKASEDPGTAIFRIWQEGVLICDMSPGSIPGYDVATLTSTGQVFNTSYVGNLWNGITGSSTPTPSQDQNIYYDDIVVVTANPPNFDIAGNPMIGDWIP
jgi:hypothetical protein